MKKETLFTGAQPTGDLHIGNYFGAIKNVVNLQKSYHSYLFIATYHSLTIPYNPKEKHKQVIDLAKTYIACGVDPKKVVIFDQVDVPAHTELAWIFNTLTPLGEAERMTQFKDKSTKYPGSINVGLLTYPILQAADILLYNAHKIPVGIDQVQHVELTRSIARWFNNKYGEYFVEPKTLLTDTPKIQSLLHPEKKMSKSDGASAMLGIFDEPDEIRNKIKRAVTGMGTEDEIPAGAHTLLTLLREIGKPEVALRYQEAIENKTIRYGDMKTEVAESLVTYFAPMRKKYLALKDKQVEAILKAGAKKANKVANKNLKDIKKLIGVA